MDLLFKYPTMENHHFVSGKSTISTGAFLKAMLVYQRGTGLCWGITLFTHLTGMHLKIPYQKKEPPLNQKIGAPLMSENYHPQDPRLLFWVVVVAVAVAVAVGVVVVVVVVVQCFWGYIFIGNTPRDDHVRNIESWAYHKRGWSWLVTVTRWYPPIWFVGYKLTNHSKCRYNPLISPRYWTYLHQLSQQTGQRLVYFNTISKKSLMIPKEEPNVSNGSVLPILAGWETCASPILCLLVNEFYVGCWTSQCVFLKSTFIGIMFKITMDFR